MLLFAERRKLGPVDDLMNGHSVWLVAVLAVALLVVAISVWRHLVTRWNPRTSSRRQGIRWRRWRASPAIHGHIDRRQTARIVTQSSSRGRRQAIA